MLERIEDVKLDLGKVNGFAALCGDRTVVDSAEQLLPLGWHQLFTHTSDPWLQHGVDGHPQERSSDVPVHLTKRMWAATEVRVTHPIRLKDHVTCERDEPVVVIKQGSSGELAFSREVMRWRRGVQVLMEEAKTVVYKAAQAVGQVQALTAPQQPMPVPEMQQVLMLDEVVLFKYSALLGVAHRIHFDQPYATQVEGYPGLVIHGPLLIQLLLKLARASQLGAFSGAYTARALRPSYLGMALQLNLTKRNDHVLLWVSDAEGNPTLTVTLRA
ncbi:hypothetical protein KI429_18135 [Pseudomonas shirazica]|uniref:hypothetical protein n=1 Tax=Pseudomonas asiatica TaxID=2219225 RepID=UPI00209A876C|nr:hypothetical protein [Pseudomonas asiatica]MCO7535991.1 hypothetical protein [Pseudomonas asiatica]MCO7549581.1 hypothetical protein [Pseudomonas asiatica]MCO7559715.1 hypothetical protein [Pseudomonas asiatica]UQB77126.1 hypothetical protein KI429_18135 [Pseudomonas shirazica]